MEETPRFDMAQLPEYLRTYKRLKLSLAKIATSSFHLNNRKSKRQLTVYQDVPSPLQPIPHVPRNEA